MAEVKILEQRENPLLNRKELSIVVIAERGTAKRDEIAGKIAAMLNVGKDVVVVDSIYQEFGTHSAKSYVKVYNSAEDLAKTEPKPKVKKEKGAAAAAPAQAAAATPATAEKK